MAILAQYEKIISCQTHGIGEGQPFRFQMTIKTRVKKGRPASFEQQSRPSLRLWPGEHIARSITHMSVVGQTRQNSE
jgi:hypothetical protein